MKKVLFGVFSISGIMVGISVLVFFIMAGMGPETFVVAGKQLPSRYLNTLRNLELLDKDERVAFFYSDALMNIKDGLYFVSDKKIAAYSKDWEPPAITADFDSIIELSFQQYDSFWDDSVIWIRTKDQTEFSILVSSEQGGDQRFHKHLLRKCKNIKSPRQLTTADPPDHFLRNVSFPDISLAEGSLISKIEIAMSCGRFRSINCLPNDWSMNIIGPRAERTKLSASANHGASRLSDSCDLHDFVTIMVCSTSSFDIVGTVWIETPTKDIKKIFTQDQLKLEK